MEGDNWRIRTNKELRNLCNDSDLVGSILGYMQKDKVAVAWLCLKDGRWERPEKVFAEQPGGRRLGIRPRIRRLDQVAIDLRQIGVRS